ncbi:MAG: alpha-glucosidase [Bacteroidota bacterium]
MKKNWWKESVIYQIYPRSFNDSNGDGIGDLRGIIQKLDYLQSLGVDILWLSPIYQSPNDDNGYDISNYYEIMDEFGTMEDFDELLAGVHERGMRLLMDLVVNHSSDEHEWFEKSRASKDNPYRDYYYWRKGKDGGPPTNWRSFFSGSAWEYDEQTDEYYLHLFTKKQPDLNWENPKVRKAIYKMMRFWLDKGVDGFRMDVISLISKRFPFADVDTSDFNQAVETAYANGPRVHEFLQEMYDQVMGKYDVMTVGEGPGINREVANLYVGEHREELNMIFHFGHMFIDHGPDGRFDYVPSNFLEFKKVFRDWDQTIGEEGWINIFLDNHDFPRMVSRWGDDGVYRIPSAKLLATLILTLRGTPCIYQGSEIGMTNVAFDSIEDYRDVEILNFYEECKANGGDLEAFLKAVHIQGRDNVRTPIHWDASANGGFTESTPWIKVNPNYPQINVENALEDPQSIFYFYQQMLAYRKANPTLIYGRYEELEIGHSQLFQYRRSDEQGEYIVVLNFGETPVDFNLPEGQDWHLEMCNYSSEEERRLGAWEARVYKAG